MSGDGSVIPVRVAVRIRPLSKKELGDGCEEALDKPLAARPQVVFRNCNDKAFTYDFAYGPNTGQDVLFQEAVNPLVDQLFKGYNATVLAYGQTGSGKTYSMGTSYSDKETINGEVTLGTDDGMIPRAVDLIFDRIKTYGKNYAFKVRVAFVELYKETLYDLLSSKGKKEDCAVELREDPKSGVKIVNLTEISVENLSATMRALEEGSNKRATAATAMNHTSSRSHAIFTLLIDGSCKGALNNESSSESALASGIAVKFHLVDLAGSERAKKTHATGNRFKEGTAINMGLLSLGNVISALGEDTTSKHIPYRDSKLTRLLQDSLGGNSHTLMIACVSPADYNIEETLSTLRYADRARKIKNKPIVNIDDKNELVARLRRENIELKLQLEQKSNGPNSDGLLEIIKAKQEVDDLQNALMACQEEMGNMNEKLLISEATGEKLKTILGELAQETDSLGLSIVDTSTKNSIEKISKKIHEVIDLHNENDKKLEEHESRAAMLTLGKYKSESSLTGNTENELDEMIEITPRRKQSTTLGNELLKLNRELLEKEQLASSMKLNDEKMKEVKEKYESSMRALEEQIAQLQKEKDDLNQQQHRVDPKGKIAEQRRIKIQELEQQMSDLRKKLLEQQRAIKLNEQNEKKVKMLNDDIISMKKAKTKLIRQMKEDAERVRAWKTQKEREVASLKQAERKQQAKMAKMETMHSKRQHVLQRKMEEAQMAKKRLEDILRLRASKAKLQSAKDKNLGLAGAVDRIREMVNHELDIVISINHATQSKENLLEDRKELTKQLKEIEKQTRMTMSTNERNNMESKRKQIKVELDARNLEIQSLQNQIMQIEETQKDSSVSCGLNGTAVGDKVKHWWDGIPTVTEAKIAVEHLFGKASDLMEQNNANSSEMKELRSLYDEACTNSVNLEKEIKQMKAEHMEEINSVKKDYEEAQTILLSKLTNPEESPAITEQDFKKFTELQKRMAMMINYDEGIDSSKVKKKNSAPRLNQKETYQSVEQYLRDTNASFTEDESNGSDDDYGWHQTPLAKRIQEARRINKKKPNGSLATYNGKRKSNEDLPDENNEFNAMKPPPAKRSLSNESTCKCTAGCGTNRCSCMKGKVKCGSHCKCTPTCSNKALVDTIDPKPSDINSNTVTDQTIDLINASMPDITIDAKSNDERHDNLTIPHYPAANKTPERGLRPELGRRRKTIFSSPLAEMTAASDLSNSFSTNVKISESCPDFP